MEGQRCDRCGWSLPGQGVNEYRFVGGGWLDRGALGMHCVLLIEVLLNAMLIVEMLAVIGFGFNVIVIPCVIILLMIVY